MSDDEFAGTRGAWPGPGTQPGPGPGQARASEPEQGPGSTRPPLRRDRRSRMIAGVCGGLGRHLDIDPVVFRILFALLTFFGGFGLLAYAAAWLFVPDDGDNESEARRLLTGRGAMAGIAVAVLVALGFLVMITVLGDGFRHAIPLLLFAAAIVAVLLWLGEGGRRPPREGDQAGWGPAADPQQPQPWWQRPVSESPAGAAPAAAGTAPGEPSDAVPGADAPFGAGPDLGAGFGPDAEPAPKRMSRRVTGLALSGAVLALGVIGVLAEAGAISVGWMAGLALTLMAVGAGMVVGGFFGRARALIPLGLVIAVPMILASALGVPLRGETGDTAWSPASAAAITAPYELAAGRGTLDLSAINPGGGTVHVTAHVGAGQLIVTVPDDVRVQVVAHVGAGQMLFTDGSKHSGLDVTRSFDSPAKGSSQGTIVLDLKAGLGDVEVQRAD